tara:strand:+ start:288 stop:434 length:147 start_codon:yes stop_codon:yes gene_type:complete
MLVLKQGVTALLKRFCKDSTARILGGSCKLWINYIGNESIGKAKIEQE